MESTYARPRLTYEPAQAGPEAPPQDVAVRGPAALVKPGQPRVDGGAALGFARQLLDRYVWWPGEHALDAVTLWAAHAAARDAAGDLIWRASPRLLVTAAQPGAGKSTVLDLLALLTHADGRMPKVTARALAHVVGRSKKVALLDEAQLTFGAGRRSEDVRAVINGGYTRRASWGAMSGSTNDAVPVFGAIAMAGTDGLITDTSGRLADTLQRCIIVRMRPATRRVPELDERGEDIGELIGTALSAWTAQAGADLKDTARALADAPGEFDAGDGGRHAQIWRPLLACADVAGGRWPEAARAAMAELSGTGAARDEGADALAELELLTAAWGQDGESAGSPS